MLLRFICFIVFIFSNTLLFSQANYGTGFYNVDSLLWQYNHTGNPADTILIAVNSFTDAAYKPYTQGVWLRNRNYTPNTWENTQFSKAGSLLLHNVDTTAKRGPLRKVNVVRVKVNKFQTAEPNEEYVFFIGVDGKENSHVYEVPVVHLYVDSMDAFGPEGFYAPGKGLATPVVPPHIPAGFQWNYSIEYSDPGIKGIIPRNRIEKDCFLSILDTNNTALDKKVGIRISGNISAGNYNKGMQVLARKKYSPGKIHTSILGEDEKYTAIRLRVGGSAQKYQVGCNELGLEIIDGLKLGEATSRRIQVYLNGSYWTMAYAQPKIDEYWAESVMGIHHDTVEIIDPMSMYPYGNGLLDITAQLKLIDTSKLGTVASPVWGTKGQIYSAYYMLQGSKESFAPIADTLLAMQYDTNYALVFRHLDSLIDLNSFMRYLSVVDFLQLNDNLGNNTLLMAGPQHKPFIVMRDFDGISIDHVHKDYWGKIADQRSEANTFLENTIQRVILKNPYCIQQLLRVAQDLYNTNFQPLRLNQLVDDMYTADFMRDMDTCHLSWGGFPNGGSNSNHYVMYKEKLHYYLTHRHTTAWKILANHWMPDEQFKLHDRRTIFINFDLLPPGIAQVQLNSLTLDSTWHGLYLPKPTVEVKLVAKGKIPAGYKLAWQEQPNAGLNLSINATKHTVLTPILVKDDRKSTATVK